MNTPDPEPKARRCCCASRRRASATATCTSGTGSSSWATAGRSRSKSRGVHLPVHDGRESLGEVVALGPRASGVKVSDKEAVAYPWIGCGECAVCRKGKELLCLSPRTPCARDAPAAIARTSLCRTPAACCRMRACRRGSLRPTPAPRVSPPSRRSRRRATILGTDDHLVIIGRRCWRQSRCRRAVGQGDRCRHRHAERAHARQMGAVRNHRQRSTRRRRTSNGSNRWWCRCGDFVGSRRWSSASTSCARAQRPSWSGSMAEPTPIVAAALPVQDDDDREAPMSARSKT